MWEKEQLKAIANVTSPETIMAWVLKGKQCDLENSYMQYSILIGACIQPWITVICLCGSGYLTRLSFLAAAFLFGVPARWTALPVNQWPMQILPWHCPHTFAFHMRLFNMFKSSTQDQKRPRHFLWSFQLSIFSTINFPIPPDLRYFTAPDSCLLQEGVSLEEHTCCKIRFFVELPNLTTHLHSQT